MILLNKEKFMALYCYRRIETRNKINYVVTRNNKIRQYIKKENSYFLFPEEEFTLKKFKEIRLLSDDYDLIYELYDNICFNEINKKFKKEISNILIEKAPSMKIFNTDILKKNEENEELIRKYFLFNRLNTILNCQIPDDLIVYTLEDHFVFDNDIFHHQKLSEDIIEKYGDGHWVSISRNQKLSEEFIEKHSDKVDWYEISRNQKLSEEFIEKHFDRLNIDEITRNQKLSEEFIEKHSDKVDWYEISQHQKLSENFIEKHKKDISWYSIIIFQEISEDFIIKNIDYFWNCIYTLFGNKEFSQNFVNFFFEKYCSSKCDDPIYNDETKMALSWCVKLSMDQIRRYFSASEESQLMQSQKLDEDFLEKRMNAHNSRRIFLYQELSIKFLEKYQDNYNFFYFFHNNKITKESIIRFKNKIEEYNDEISYANFIQHALTEEEFIEIFNEVR